MNTRVERESRDILKMLDDRLWYPSLPEYRRTVAVSLAAVTLCGLCGRHLEYVPESVTGREFEGRMICRAALAAGDADCTLLPHIPFADVQKEGIRQFSGDTPAFVLYSFADITDAKTAQEAVKADAYCIQLVPDRLLTADLCKMALQSPNADKKVLEFIPEKFRTPEMRKMAEEKFGDSRERKEAGKRERSPQPERKHLSF